VTLRLKVEVLRDDQRAYFQSDIFDGTVGALVGILVRTFTLPLSLRVGAAMESGRSKS
jgi:hypothetical protein